MRNDVCSYKLSCQISRPTESRNSKWNKRARSPRDGRVGVGGWGDRRAMGVVMVMAIIVMGKMKEMEEMDRIQ